MQRLKSLKAICFVSFFFLLSNCGYIYMKDLDDPNLYVKKKAIYILGEKQKKSAVPKLLKLLEHPSEDIVIEAITALGKIKSKEATNKLLPFLKSDNKDLKLKGIESIGMIRDVRGVEPLISILATTNDVEIRIVSLWGLGNIGDRDSVPILMKFKKDQDKFVRYNAEHALSMIK